LGYGKRTAAVHTCVNRFTIVMIKNIKTLRAHDKVRTSAPVIGEHESLNGHNKKDLVDVLKKSLHEKEVLLKEVHHRVKNNLQVITSLLKLQSQHVSDPELLYIIKETQNRIMAMSFAHQKLYQSKNFSEVDFCEYLKKIVSQIVHIFGTESKNIKISINSESVKLGIETAIPCGMLVNEIITNSVKHAFPNNEKGEIKISFRKEDGNNYGLTVGDNGIGMSGKINIAEAKTLGLQLIETLARQIDAKLELHGKKGMEYRITFKPVTYKKRV
jgi:two-component sensor histidine kinase